MRRLVEGWKVVIDDKKTHSQVLSIILAYTGGSPRFRHEASHFRNAIMLTIG